MKMKMTLLKKRMRSDLIETFKLINGISNYDRRFFQYLSSNWKFTVKADFKNEVYEPSAFFANRVIYFGNKLPSQKQ